MKMLFKQKGLSTAPLRFVGDEASRQGVATIPIILALTILVVAVGLAISTVAFNEVFIAQEFSRSSQALEYAQAGARDALMKITRDGRYTTSPDYKIEFVSGGCTAPYNGCATVTVTSDWVTLPISDVTIVSEGMVKSSIRKVQVVAVLDDINWVITGTNWQEITN